MFGLTITFLALLHSGEVNVPIGELKSTSAAFPTEQLCREAGDALAKLMSPRVDKDFRAMGAGVLQGTRVDCVAEKNTTI